VADGPEAFAAALVVGLGRPDLLGKQAARGRERVLAEYDWDRLTEQMDQVWRAAALPAAGRANSRAA
jgi:hypothetical protein